MQLSADFKQSFSYLKVIIRPFVSRVSFIYETVSFCHKIRTVYTKLITFPFKVTVHRKYNLQCQTWLMCSSCNMACQSWLKKSVVFVAKILRRFGKPVAILFCSSHQTIFISSYFWLVIGFVEHSLVVTTSNYSAVTNSHMLPFTTSPIKLSSCCILYQCPLLMYTTNFLLFLLPS